MQQIYQMHGLGIGDSRSVIDVRNDGKIVAVYADLIDDTGTPSAGNTISWELSFASASNFQTNDATSVIAAGTGVCDASASCVARFTQDLLDIPVQAGERLFVHHGGADNAGTRTNLLVVIDEKGSSSRVSRRR